MNFLPKTYTPPKSSSDYMKFQDGANKFRVISDSLIGFMWWTDEDGKRKPNRVKTQKEVPMGTADVKHFWAFVVYNYETSDINILEITQKSIQTGILDLYKNEDWGHPKDYDINVSKTGKDMETRYNVTPSPKKELKLDQDQKFKADNISLEALFTGEDPFNFLKPEPMSKEKIKELNNIKFS